MAATQWRALLSQCCYADGSCLRGRLAAAPRCDCQSYSAWRLAGRGVPGARGSHHSRGQGYRTSGWHIDGNRPRRWGCTQFCGCLDSGDCQGPWLGGPDVQRSRFSPNAGSLPQSPDRSATGSRGVSSKELARSPRSRNCRHFITRGLPATFPSQADASILLRRLPQRRASRRPARPCPDPASSAGQGDRRDQEADAGAGALGGGIGIATAGPAVDRPRASHRDRPSH